MFVLLSEAVMSESTYLMICALLTPIILWPAAFWLWMLLDCIKNEPPGSRDKAAWIFMFLLLGIFGAFAYDISRRKKRIRRETQAGQDCLEE